MFKYGLYECCCDECLAGDDLIKRCERLYDITDGDWQPEYCTCDKMSGGFYLPFYMSGWCEDAFRTPEPSRPQGKRKSGRQYRRYQKKRHMDKDLFTSHITCFKINYNSRYDEPWNQPSKWLKTLEHTGLHLTYRGRSNCTRCLKRISNKAVRKYNGGLNHGDYKRVFDYRFMAY